jgi:hypothetical protein
MSNVEFHNSSMACLLSMHLTRRAPDRTHLRGALPQSLGFEVYWNESMQLYGTDTFRASKPNKWPFTYATPATDLPLEMGPHLSEVSRAYEALRASGSCDGFKRSYVNLVELLSQALGQPVLTVYADDDEADFACLAEDGRAISIVARCDEMVLRFEKGSSNSQPAAEDRTLHANAAEMVRVFSGQDPMRMGMGSCDPPENYGFVHVRT